MRVGDGTPIGDQAAGRGTQQERQSHLDAVAIPAEWRALELAAQLIRWNGSMIVTCLGQTAPECAYQRVALVQCPIIFVDAEILEIRIGCIATQSRLDRGLLVEDTIGYLGKARVDAGEYLAECTPHSITGALTIEQWIVRTMEEDTATAHGLR